MAQSLTDFSSEIVGQPSSLLTAVNSTTSINVIDDGGGVKAVRMVPSDRHMRVRLNDLSQASGTVEGLICFRINGITSFREGFGVAIHGDAGLNPGYIATSRTSGSWSNRLRNNLATTIAEAATVNKTGVKQWCRFRVTRTSESPDTFDLAAWWWDDGDTPKVNTDTPDLSSTGQTANQGNYITAYWDDGNANTVDLFFYSVGTEGQPAPLVDAGTVDTDGEVLDGQGNVTFVYDESPFSTPPTVGRYKVGTDTSADLANFSAASGSGSFTDINLKSISLDQAGVPFGSTILELRNGLAETLDIYFLRSPATGWSFQNLVGDPGTTGYISEGRGAGAYSDGSQAYFPSGVGVNITQAGLIESDTSFTAFVWDINTATWEVVTFTTGTPPPNPGGSSSARRQVRMTMRRPIKNSLLQSIKI